MHKKWMLCVGLSLAALVATGCGDDDENCGDADIRLAQSRIASQLVGELGLTVETEEIRVPVTLSNTVDGCALDVVLTQGQLKICGGTFEGKLTYDKNAEPPVWEGRLWGDFEDEEFHTPVDVTLQVRKQNIVTVNANIVDGRDPLCKDRSLTGDVHPR